jgi:hypothetical protein
VRAYGCIAVAALWPNDHPPARSNSVSYAPPAVQAAMYSSEEGGQVEEEKEEVFLAVYHSATGPPLENLTDPLRAMMAGAL